MPRIGMADFTDHERARYDIRKNMQSCISDASARQTGMVARRLLQMRGKGMMRHDNTHR
jgi:hypothetical protein